jgi:hypothetical protein
MGEDFDEFLEELVYENDQEALQNATWWFYSVAAMSIAICLTIVYKLCS